MNIIEIKLKIVPITPRILVVKKKKNGLFAYLIAYITCSLVFFKAFILNLSSSDPTLIKS